MSEDAASEDELRFMADLIQRQPKGQTLLQPFYCDPRVLEWDLEVALRRRGVHIEGRILWTQFLSSRHRLPSARS